MIRPAPFVLGLALAVGLAACAGLDRQGTADALAAAAGLRRIDIAAPPFTLTAYVRPAPPGLPLTVYIEGDGLAWRSRTRLSDDPTPLHPQGLELAARDPAPALAYLARPCQYRGRRDPACDSSAYWSGRRFSEEVVAAMNQAVQTLRDDTGATALDLVGFSGGGAIAALIAARRDDVASLRTVAANLDHAAVNAHHRVDPMPDSLNPIDCAAGLSRLPQIHFVGADDTVVPPFVAHDFARAQGQGACVTVREIDGAAHGNGWTERWPALLRHRPACPP